MAQKNAADDEVGHAQFKSLARGQISGQTVGIHTTFNYPTMAEAYRVAALNGYNPMS